MNILYMVSWYFSEGESPLTGSFHFEQATDLSKNCNIAVYYPYDRKNTQRVSKLVDRGLLTYRSKYKLEKKISNRVNMFIAMRQIKKEFKPDLIHAHVATEAGRFAVLFGSIFSIPVIVTEHSTVEASGVMQFPHYYYARNVYKKSKYNICVSDYLANRLRDIFPKYQFDVIYNGITKPIVKQHISYRKQQAVNIVMVAGMYDWNIKGIPIYMEVAKKIIEEGQNLMLHFVGGGDYFDQFVQLADRLEIAKHCVFYGNCDKNKVYEIINDMDFLVSASRFESFGCSMAEALMLGKPVLATRSGGAQSIVTEDNGILIEKDSETALYEGLIKMIHSFKNYDSKQLIEDAEEKFEIGKISKKYLDIYRQFIK